jgi:hypothetical protein
MMRVACRESTSFIESPLLYLMLLCVGKKPVHVVSHNRIHTISGFALGCSKAASINLGRAQHRLMSTDWKMKGFTATSVLIRRRTGTTFQFVFALYCSEILSDPYLEAHEEV